MTPQDIYDAPLVHRGGLEEMMNNRSMWPGMPEEASWRHPEIAELDVYVHGIVRHDYRRAWTVFSVWWKDEPIACGRKAGREGDDSYEAWITDAEGYMQLVAAVSAALAVPPQAISQDQDIGDVWSWYGEQVKPGQNVHRHY